MSPIVSSILDLFGTFVLLVSAVSLAYSIRRQLRRHHERLRVVEQIVETFETMRSTHKLHLTNDALRQHLEGVSAIQTEIVRRFKQLPEEKKASWRETLSAEERELLEDLLAEEHERTDPAFQVSAQKAEANRG